MKDRIRSRSRLRPSLLALEARRLMAAGISEFPLRTLGGVPAGTVTDGAGDVWFVTENNVGKRSMVGGTPAQYAIPTYNSGPGAMTLGPDGNPWFLQATTRSIARVDRATGAITEHPLLTWADPGLTSIVAGPAGDDGLYFTMKTVNRIGRFDVSDGTVREYVTPQGSQPHDITRGIDGGLWYTMSGLGQVGRLDTATGAMESYTIEVGGNAGLTGIASTADGTLYLSATTANKIATFQVATRQQGPTYAVPTAGAGLGEIAVGPGGQVYVAETTASKIAIVTPGVTMASEVSSWNGSLGSRYPTTLTVGGDGNVYFGASNAHRLGQMGASGQALTQVTYTSTTGNSPAEMVVGEDGALWYTLPASMSIGRFDPVTQVSQEFPLTLKSNMGTNLIVGPGGDFFFNESGRYIARFNPTTRALIREYETTSANPGITDLAYNPVDGGLWFTQRNTNTIGRLNLATGNMTEVAAPTANAGLGTIIVTAKAGESYDGYIWFSEQLTGKVGRINPATNPVTVTEHDLIGSAGWTSKLPTLQFEPGTEKVWFTTGTSYRTYVGTFDPANPGATPETYAIPNYVLSGVSSGSADLTLTADGQVAFTEVGEFGGIAILHLLDPVTRAVKAYNIGAHPADIVSTGDGNVWYTLSGAPGKVGLLTRSAASLPTSIAFERSPAYATANKGFGLIVAVKNAAGQVDTDYTGDVKISLTGNPTGATLAGTLTAQAVRGRAVFRGLSLDKAGNGYVITASTATGQPPTLNPGYPPGQDTYTAASAPFTVADLATRVIVSAPAGPIEAGRPFVMTVQAVDADGRIDSSYAGQATLTIDAGPAGSALGGTRIVDLTGGIATFTNLVLTTVGTYTLKATAPGLAPATSASFDVVPAAPTRLVLTTSVPSVTAGSTTTLTVSALDAFGNVVTGFAGTVQLSTDDAQLGPIGPLTFTPADQGVASIVVSPRTAGTRTFTATLTGLPVGATILVTPAAASRLVLELLPPGVTAGVTFALAARAVDPFGNTDTSYRGTFRFGSDDANAELPPDMALTAADAGRKAFLLRLRGLGNRSVTVVDTVNGALLAGGTVAVSANTATVDMLPPEAPPVYGQSWTVQALVTPTVPGGDPLTGGVQFAVDGIDVGGPVSVSAFNNLATSPTLVGLGIGAHTITARYLGDPTTTATAAAPLSVNVAPAVLTVVAGGGTRLYGQANPILGATITGFAPGEDASVLGGTLVVSADAGVASDAGAYDTRAGGLVSSNYVFQYVTGTLTVLPAPLTITALDATATYGTAPSPKVTYDGFVMGQGASSLAGSLDFAGLPTPGTPVGRYAITPFGLASGNYAITYLPATVTITPASLTITPNDLIRSIGVPLPAATFRYDGFVLGETSAVLATLPTATTDAGDSSPAGSYEIRAGGAGAANYTISYGKGTLTVLPAVRPLGTATVLKKRAINGLTIDLDGPLNPASARNLSAFRLVSAGKDRRLGTRDDKVIKLRSVAYDEARSRITLTLRAPLGADVKSARLRATGLVDARGQAIDGNRDGRPGGDLVVDLLKKRPAIVAAAPRGPAWLVR